MKSNKSVLILMSVMASAFLVGCGGGGGGGDSTPATGASTTGTGNYVDSAVEGASYECGSQRGITDVKGKFNFEKGQDCTFSIGTMLLRKVPASALNDKVTILEDDTRTAQLLQSLDMDGDARNGITLSAQTSSMMSENNIKTVPTEEVQINDLVAQMGTRDSDYKGRFVSEQEADVHVAQTQANMNNGGNTNGGNQGNMNNGGNTNGGNQGNMNNGGGMNSGGGMSAPSSSTLQDFNYVAFSKALAVPALASYTIDADGYKVFALNIDEGTTEFFDGIQTNTYGINAAILGETIRMHRDDKIKLQYTNNLAVPTTMHGHGMHVPAIMDGGPINKIQPGEMWEAKYTVNQKACTNWYHPHFMHKTADHVYLGLAGFILIDDAESDALNLPKEYGVDDFPIAIQDKRFDANGQIDYSPTTMEIRMGYKADVMMANGVILPYVDVPAKKVRLRLLNGSNASVYNLKFSDNRAFTQIAVDNSFLEHPVKNMTSVLLTPGERAEIVVDFTGKKGDVLTLVDGSTGLDIMQIKVSKDPNTVSEIPENLTTLEKEDDTAAIRTRKFVLNMARGDDGAMHMAINGKLMDMMRIDEYVPKDDVEVWEITNQMGMTHNFHIHATHFFPLTRNGAPVAANEQGYKDVISMPGKSTMRVVVKMTDYVDENTGYMYHCHFLEHEDDGMMGQFAVTNGKADVNVRP